MGVKKDNRDQMRSEVAAIIGSKTVKMSQAETARRIGISPGSLSNWLRGKKGSYTEIEDKIEIFLESYTASKKITNTLPPDPKWVATPTGERVFQTLELGQFMGKLVVVYGAAGSGKTKTAEYYMSQRSNVWMFTMTKATASVRGMLMMMCRKMNICDPGKGNHVIENAIVEKIRGTGGMMLVDEAQQASQGALEQLRQMQEAAGVGMALLGNNPLMTQMSGGFRSESFAQLFSRIAKPTHIKGTQKEDVLVLAGAVGITDSSTLGYLTEIGTLPGGLRGVVNTIQLAQLTARGSGKKLNRAAIASAWKTLTA